MDYEVGLQTILDAILLVLVEIASNEQRGVGIIPETNIAQKNGVSIIHPVSGYELWPSGSVDYAVVEFEDVEDHKARLVGPSGTRGVHLDIVKGYLPLIEAKRRGPEYSLLTYVPRAVSQSIALLKSANLPEVRSCLSDGEGWIFFVVRIEKQMPVYYESVQYFLTRDALRISDKPLREIVQLLCEWLRPTKTDLYELVESE